MMENLVAVVSAVGVVDGRVEPNIEVLEEEGFLVVDRRRLEVPAELARIIAPNEPETSEFTGVCVALLLKRESAFDRFDKAKGELDNIYASSDSWAALRDQRLFFPVADEQKELERTLIIVKPDYSQDDYEAVLEVIEQNNFVIIGKLARILSADVLRGLFPDNAESKERLDYMASDVSLALVLEKVGAVDDWNLLMGPSDPSLAKSVAPTSLRARLGTDSVRNFVYGSESVARAKADIAKLFPTPFPMERTLAIVKPDVVQAGNLDKVLTVIRQNGFTVLAKQRLHISQTRARQLYNEHKDRPYFDALTSYMSEGPVHVMVLGKAGAVSAWRKLMGPADVAQARATNPTSLRALYGTDNVRNGFHGSETTDSAKDEIDAYFPQLPVEKVPNLLEVEDLLNAKPAPRANIVSKQSLNDVLVEGLTQLCRAKPVGDEAITWLAHWLLRNNPNKPTVELPSDEKSELGVVDTISSANDNATVKVVWAMGAPGSGRDQYVASVVRELGYEYVSAVDLVASAIKQGTEYGELAKQCAAAGRPVPTTVYINLIKRALLNTKKATKFVLNGFPNNLDQAFEFEKKICPVDFLLYFDCAEDTATERALRAAGAGGAEAVAAAQSAFKEESFPVVEHFQVFGKVKTINTDAPDEAGIKARVLKLFR